MDWSKFPNKIKENIASRLLFEDRLAFRQVSWEAKFMAGPVRQASEPLQKFVVQHLPPPDAIEPRREVVDVFLMEGIDLPLQISSLAEAENALQLIPQYKRMMMSMYRLPELANTMAAFDKKELAEKIDVMAARWARGRAQIGKEFRLGLAHKKVRTINPTAQSTNIQVVRSWVGEVLEGQNKTDAHATKEYIFPSSKDIKGCIEFHWASEFSKLVQWVDGLTALQPTMSYEEWPAVNDPIQHIASEAFHFALPYRVAIQSVARAAPQLELVGSRQLTVDIFRTLANRFIKATLAPIQAPNNVSTVATTNAAKGKARATEAVTKTAPNPINKALKYPLEALDGASQEVVSTHLSDAYDRYIAVCARNYIKTIDSADRPDLPRDPRNTYYLSLSEEDKLELTRNGVAWSRELFVNEFIRVFSDVVLA